MFVHYSLASSSKGNCHILSQDDKNFIMLDCGISLSNIIKKLSELKIKLSQIKACYITHDHKDHWESADDLSKFMDVYSSEGTSTDLFTVPVGKNQLTRTKYKTQVIGTAETIKVSGLQVLGFNVSHNTSEPYGFIVRNELKEYFVYLTDTGEINLKLEGIQPTMIVVECSFCEIILLDRIERNKVNEVVYNRLMSGQGHLSIQKLKKLLSRLDLRYCKQISLCHVSLDNGKSNFDKDIYEFLDNKVTVKQLHHKDVSRHIVNEIEVGY